MVDVERLPTNRASSQSKTCIDTGARLVERRGQGWSQMRLIPALATVQIVYTPAPFIIIAEDLRDLRVALLLMFTQSNLLHCNDGKLPASIISKFPPGSCGARCGLRNAGWCTGCWLLGT